MSGSPRKVTLTRSNVLVAKTPARVVLLRRISSKWGYGNELLNRPFGPPNDASTICPGSGTAIFRSTTASNSWKIAPTAPMPRASEATANAVNTGLRRSNRNAWRKSCAHASNAAPAFTSRISSTTRSTRPNSIAAARRAACGSRPLRSFSFTSRS